MKTPVYFPKRVEAYLTRDEINILLDHQDVEEEEYNQIVDWYGNVYGRYHYLVPHLIEQWNKAKETDPNTSLASIFYTATTMSDSDIARLLPPLDKNLRPLLLRIWNGTTTDEDVKTLDPYGILKDNREWSCEFVRRKYFFDLFQAGDAMSHVFTNTGHLPNELDIAKVGLQNIKWNQLQMSRESSVSGFPIEDIWQTKFYGSIGPYVSPLHIFCKEYATDAGTRGGSVDFVLWNGKTRAIELLIKSDKVCEHHERFENGAYQSLRLSGTYLVVDIKPWGKIPDMFDYSEEEWLKVANDCFSDANVQKGSRRFHHAVFLVSNNLSFGALFAFDQNTAEVKAVQFLGQFPCS